MCCKKLTLSCKKLTLTLVMHYNTISSKDVKRGKKFTLKMPLQRMKKFLRLKAKQLTE